MQEQSYDAIVVGSGISGGWAAKELTEKGLRVLLLERGKNIEHIKDYPNATKAPWEYPHRGGRTRAMEAAYPVLKRDYPLNEKNLDWWASDQESPYTEIKRFDWYRGYHVGGRSLMWGRQSYRWSDFDFEANAREGVGTDWPITVEKSVPELRVELEALEHKLIDLLPVIREHVYHPAFLGSFSLKYVLTPLVPDLTYDDLVIVDGLVASVEIARLLFVAQKIAPEERDRVRQDLLNYCERDTWAMVKLLERLRELAA